MSNFAMETTCGGCNSELLINIPDDLINSIRLSKSESNVRSLIKPIGNILVYRITTDDMKAYLQQQAKYYASGTRLELVPKYTERRSSDGTKKSYASVRIAFSEEVVEKNLPDGFFSKIGNDSSNVRIVKDIWVEMIQKYKFDKDEIEGYLSSYKKLEELEDKFGITEKYLEDVKLYTTPRRFTTTNKESWIVFSARADKIISNMLEDIDTDALNGFLEISSVNVINQSLVEFIVYIHPNVMGKNKDNLYVRKMMESDSK